VFVSKDEENGLESDEASVAHSQAGKESEGEDHQSEYSAKRPLISVTEHSRTVGIERQERD
jgi:hypothetical protein